MSFNSPLEWLHITERGKYWHMNAAPELKVKQMRGSRYWSILAKRVRIEWGRGDGGVYYIHGRVFMHDLLLLLFFLAHSPPCYLSIGLLLFLFLYIHLLIYLFLPLRKLAPYTKHHYISYCWYSFAHCWQYPIYCLFQRYSMHPQVCILKAMSDNIPSWLVSKI